MTEKIIFEPGKYYVGDIGYALDHEYFSEFPSYDQYVTGLYTTKSGSKYWYAKMPHERGTLYDKNDIGWGFDFGCFGCILFKDIITKANYSENKVDFKEPFKVSYQDNIVKIGHLTFSFNPSQDFIKRSTPVV